eukprot:1158599-Pelagomonas_calceolata.AAC.16
MKNAMNYRMINDYLAVLCRPRSGHYTMDGCVTCQFENHTRAILGWPLGSTSLNCGTSIMLNILGEADDDEGVRIELTCGVDSTYQYSISGPMQVAPPMLCPSACPHSVQNFIGWPSYSTLQFLDQSNRAGTHSFSRAATQSPPSRCRAEEEVDCLPFKGGGHMRRRARG